MPRWPGSFSAGMLRVEHRNAQSQRANSNAIDAPMRRRRPQRIVAFHGLILAQACPRNGGWGTALTGSGQSPSIGLRLSWMRASTMPVVCLNCFTTR